MEPKFSAGLGYQPDSGAFTDLNRLNQLKVGKGRDGEENVRKVAQEFESLFINEMLKSMRQANEAFAEGNYLNSNEGKTYQDMHDQQLAVTMANNKGIGLADVLTRQLSKTLAPQSRPNPFASAQQVTAAPTAPVAVADATGFKEAPVDQVALLNRRRLSLPGKLGLSATVPAPQATLEAGANPHVAYAPATKALAQENWQMAQSYAAPADKALTINAQTAPMPTRFASAQEFVEVMLPMAERAAQKIGVKAEVLVAQAALETGWGKAIIKQGDGSSSHNLFGIKTHGVWQGRAAKVNTTEYRDGQAVRERASFRSYGSYEQSFDDYVSFLQSNGRYAKALTQTANGEQYARELQKAGYATDPHYASKINQIARKLKTYQTVASVDGATLRTRG